MRLEVVMLKDKRKLIALTVLLLLLVAVLIGCDDEEASTVEQEFVFMIPGEASSYDPNITNETYGSIVLLHMYEGLLKIDETGALVPAAATYEVSDQNTTFTFTLRDDLKWSDGKQVTAHDYRNSWMRFISPDTDVQSASVISPYILNVTEYMAGEVDVEAVGIHVLDDLTLQIKTKAPTPFLPDILTHNIFLPVRLDAVETGDNWSRDPEIALTNGPFVLSDYEAGSYIELKKNEHYWDKESIQLDTIRFTFRKESHNIIDMYNNKEIDGLFEITTTELRNIPDSELDTNSRILPSTAFMTFNHANELMQNKYFREAISIGTDRKAIVDNVLSGAGIPTKYLVPLNYQIADEAFRDYTELDDGVQIEKAKELIQMLKDEGTYDGRAIRFHYMDGGPDAAASKYLIEKLGEDLEIEFDVYPMSWPDLYDIALNGDYDFLMMGWGADYPHPMTFLTVFEKDSFYHPITRWRDLEYEAMIKEFLLITDEKEGLDKLRAIEDAILDEHHIVPVYYRKGISLISSNVKGWYQYGTTFNFSRARIEN